MSATTGHSPSTDVRAPSVDEKDVSAWKLPQQVTKQEFRHWLDTIDTNLDAVHHFKYSEVVLDKVKRSEEEVNMDNLEVNGCIGQRGRPRERDDYQGTRSRTGWLFRWT